MTISSSDIASMCIAPQDSIRQAMACIDDHPHGHAHGIVLVVDGDRRLLGTVTDGDIRRALLNGLTLDSAIREAMKGNPIVAPGSLPGPALRKLMEANTIHHLPIVDDDGRVIALEYLNTAAAGEDKMVTAVVMAGGKGQRLRPLTEKVPKPMLPIEKRPILDILLESLQTTGFNRVLISVGYLKEAIQDYFEDGSSRGLDIHYLVESEPLGTAGALSLIPEALKPSTPFLVINGDLLTRLNFAAFRDFHMAADYEFTLCCRPHEVGIPYGYPVIEGDLVTDFREKPSFNFLVNSGIYCLSPELLGDVPQNTFFNMTDLIHRLCKTRRRVGVFPLREPFHEIGRPESYQDAVEFYQEHFEPHSNRLNGAIHELLQETQGAIG